MNKIISEQIIHGLASKEFVLFFQPIICSQKNTIFAFEGLSRWYYKNVIQSPAEFLPFIYKNQLINKLFCLNVIEQASSFSIEQKCLVNLNLSIKNLLDDDIYKSLSEKLSQGSNLCLEIIEEEKIFDDVHAVKMMNGLRSKGAIIALDDFGTGHNSLSYLRKFPIDIIKIDKQFLKDLDVKKNQDIIMAVVHLAKALDIKVVAEGVENNTQLDYVTSLGVDAVQGYYFSQPLHPNTVNDFINEFNSHHNKQERLEDKKISNSLKI